MNRSHARATFLQDVLTCAVEGGTGYWAAASDYHWSDDDPASARVTLWPEDEPGTSHAVTVDTIARGLSIIGAGEVRYLSDARRAHLMQASAENDGSEIDADDADVIVQVALFGQVVYG